jgi:hypothetical protein
MSSILFSSEKSAIFDAPNGQRAETNNKSPPSRVGGRQLAAVGFVHTLPLALDDSNVITLGSLAYKTQKYQKTDHFLFSSLQISSETFAHLQCLDGDGWKTVKMTLESPDTLDVNHSLRLSLNPVSSIRLASARFWRSQPEIAIICLHCSLDVFHELWRAERRMRKKRRSS